MIPRLHQGQGGTCCLLCGHDLVGSLISEVLGKTAQQSELTVSDCSIMDVLEPIKERKNYRHVHLRCVLFFTKKGKHLSQPENPCLVKRP